MPHSPDYPRLWQPSCDRQHPHQAASENHDQLRGAVDVVVAHWKKVEPRGLLGVGSDHRPRRVRAWVADRARGVGDAAAPRHVHALLADPFVRFAVGAQPNHELLTLYLAQVVKADRHLQLHRQRVRHVDQRVDAGERLAFLEAPQQSLRRRPHASRIDPELPVQLARALDRADPARPHRLVGALDLELEVIPRRRHLELVKLEGHDFDVDLAADLQARYSRWSKKLGYEIATHSAPSISVLPLAIMPATASAIAMRWSPAESTRAPSRSRGPLITHPSSCTVMSAPIARSPVSIAYRRSDFFTRSSAAPAITVVPRICVATTASTGSSSIICAAIVASTRNGRVSPALRTRTSATGSPASSLGLARSMRKPIDASRSAKAARVGFMPRPRSRRSDPPTSPPAAIQKAPELKSPGTLMLSGCRCSAHWTATRSASIAIFAPMAPSITSVWSRVRTVSTTDVSPSE